MIAVRYNYPLFAPRQQDLPDDHLLELLFVRNLRALMADVIGRTAPGQKP
ncbi:hypothetical protein MPC4_80189 [Methylocella tundrae]|uniref:Uncharacterized protein n=1 Tax=Methylocella tundrae TaxID=227605 RepID=A0A8B6MD87_METTU|nr:hypothetical protein [Methylocella tundrae]VTZ28232.1 hypothetical protein MPC1_8120005 [Methylocella tundrae]VTZ52518.1 hypothetical protein MPC4_80189 [Methylocella tundrae]